MLRHLSFLILLGSVSVAASDLPFYAFQNGVRFANDELRADALKELGFDGIGSAQLPPDGELAPLFATYRERGLKVFSFYTGVEITGEGTSIPPGLLDTIPKMKGHEVVLEFFIKGDKTLPKEDAVETVRKIADLAAAANVELVLYPHANFYVETLDEAVEFAKAVDRENVGVMFNLCHFLRIEPESDLRETLSAAGNLLKQVSISGADEGGTDWSALIQPLGRGSYDVSSLMTLLDELGFEGPVGLQCFNIEGESETFLKASINAWQMMP